MTDEHNAEAFGIVKQTGDFDGDDSMNMRMWSIAKDIEDHGEIHAKMDIEDGAGGRVEVEMRLGTTLVDYDTKTFKVWDGDQYYTFPAEKVLNTYKPFEVFH